MAFSLSLSMNTTTLRPTLTLPKVSRVSGFSATTRVQLKTRRMSGSRISLVVAQSSSNNGPASVKVKYDKVLKELEPISGNYVKAVTKRVNMWKEYATAHEKTKSACDRWGDKLLEVDGLFYQLRLIVANTSATSEDVASLNVKYDKAVNELETLANDFIEAGMKRAEMWNEHATACEDEKLSWDSWVKTTEKVTELQSQLGIDVENSSSSSDDDGFTSLKVKCDKVRTESGPAGRKYLEAKMKRVKMGNKDESEEELLAWESWEKKKLELLELQMQMYILRPGIKF